MISTTDVSHGSLSHLPALDSVRGLAVGLVLFHHLFTTSYYQTEFDAILGTITRPWWVGVDLFFVLSGFLITRILISSREKANYLRNFFIRRGLRIFPLYYATLFLFLVLVPMLGFPFAQVYRDIPLSDKFAYFFYYINYMLPDSSQGNLMHFWSLCVEEHFYLVWPFIVLFAGKRLGLIVFLMILAVQGLRFVAMWFSWPEAWIYHATHSRVDAMLFGAVIALVHLRYPAAPKCAKIFTGIVLVLAAGIFFWAGWRWNVRGEYIGAIIALPILGIMWAAFILMVLWEAFPRFLHFLFDHDWMRRLGKHSYAIYLFHWPVLFIVSMILFGSDSPPGGAWGKAPQVIMVGFLSLICTFGLSWVSWKLIEKPCLDLKRFFA